MTNYSLATALIQGATAIQAAIIAKSIEMRRKLLIAYSRDNQMNSVQDALILNDDKPQYQRFAIVPHLYYFPMNANHTAEAIKQLTYFLRAPAINNLQTPTYEDCEDQTLYATEYATPLRLNSYNNTEGAFCQPSAIALQMVH